MRRSRPLIPALALFVALYACAATFTLAQPATRRATTRPAPQRTAAPPDISFTVAMPRPDTHLLEVEMRVRLTSAQPHLDLLMPVWTPGSYLVREYARHVQDFTATDMAGRQLEWTKTNKNTWRINTGAAREIVVRYRVYSNELTVRTNELNDQHAFWNNAALLMYVNGHLRAPATVRVVPHGTWRIATGLPAVAGQPNTFRAEHFDQLYDSPFLVGNLRTLEFTARNTPHRIVISGVGNYNAESLQRDTQRIVETTLELMGGEVPYRDYTFMLMLRTGGGGLEHLNSTALIWPRFNFRPEASYRGFLSLVAHEYFHVWNVKLIRPDALGPFDYTQENYTRLLWVAEGVTSYYEDVILRRAGLLTDRQYLSALGGSITALQHTPGRRAISLEEASFDAWIRYYRRDENAVNTQVSYYDKGALVATLLDLEIRRASNGARSLDDVMRHLYTEFAQRNRNYTPADFQRAAEQVAGTSLDDFFRRYVRGTDELDYNAALAYVGLRVVPAPAGASSMRAELAHLGVTLAQDGDRLVVREVRAGRPAYEQGLNANDQIVAIDGLRATRDTLNARLDERQAGDTIRLTVFRFDELREIAIRLGERERELRVVPVEQPTPEQMAAYQAWLGAPFPTGGAGRN